MLKTSAAVGAVVITAAAVATPIMMGTAAGASRFPPPYPPHAPEDAEVVGHVVGGGVEDGG